VLHYNPNPYDAEPIYNLGLSLLFQRKFDAAYESFYKASWTAPLQDTAYLQLARIEVRKQHWTDALMLLERSLIRNSRGFLSRHLKTVVLRKLHRTEEARSFAMETIALDPFEFGSLYELAALAGEDADTHEYRTLQKRIRNSEHSYIEIAIDYATAGLYQDAINLLQLCKEQTAGPMLHYYLAWSFFQLGKEQAADEQLRIAASKNPDGVFPNRLQDIIILQFAISRQPDDFKACYYLGNLWYDKRQYAEAIQAWETAKSINANFPTVRRNLAIAYFNHAADPEAAVAEMEAAFNADASDARVLMELDQLRKRLNSSIADRYELLKDHKSLLKERDDLYLEFLTLENLLEHHEQALALLMQRKFHPWEGGEGKIAAQYQYAKISLAKEAMNNSEHRKAISLLEEAADYPDNLGEGKLPTSSESNIDFYLGSCYRELDQQKKAVFHFRKAVQRQLSPTAALYYNDSPPDHVLYQGWCWQALGENEKAKTCFQQLIDYGTDQLQQEPRKDYFAVSLPDLLIFDEDAVRRNAVHCHYMIGLGYLGQQQKNKAAEQFRKVLELDRSHIGVRQYSNEIKLPVETA